MAVLASNFFFGDRERDLPTRDVRYTPKCRGVGGDHHPRIFLYERRATPGLGQAGELSSQISEKKETQPTHIKKRRIIQRFFLETRPFEVHAFYVYLSCFMTQLQMVHGGDTRRLCWCRPDRGRVCVGGEARRTEHPESRAGRGVGEAEETNFGGWVEEAQAV